MSRSADSYDDTPFFWEHPEIDWRLKNVLTNLLHNQFRVRIFLGDPATGQDWEEEYDTMGYIGRTTGQHKIPILVNNSRSLGGRAILTNCIVKITYSTGNFILWQHPNYHHAVHTIRACKVQCLEGDYLAEVLKDGEPYVHFKTILQANNWVDFIEGRRNNKG